MESKLDKEAIALIRKTMPTLIAYDILSVQPMPNDILHHLYDNSMTKEELTAQGYEPVNGPNSLMWIKKNKEKE